MTSIVIEDSCQCIPDCVRLFWIDLYWRDMPRHQDEFNCVGLPNGKTFCRRLTVLHATKCSWRVKIIRQRNIYLPLCLASRRRRTNDCSNWHWQATQKAMMPDFWRCHQKRDCWVITFRLRPQKRFREAKLRLFKVTLHVTKTVPSGFDKQIILNFAICMSYVLVFILFYIFSCWWLDETERHTLIEISICDWVLQRKLANSYLRSYLIY